MNKSFKTTAQAGFTLIELIVVIVILGILAATAMPKFMDLGGDARAATLNAARAGLNSIAELAHARYLANTTGVPLPSTTVDGKTITYVNKYPAADTDFAGVAAPDFTALAGGAAGVAATATAPAVPANSIAIIPTSVAGTATAVKCFITYTQAAAGAKPVVSAPPKGEDCE